MKTTKIHGLTRQEINVSFVCNKLLWGCRQWATVYVDENELLYYSEYGFSGMIMDVKNNNMNHAKLNEINQVGIWKN